MKNNEVTRAVGALWLMCAATIVILMFAALRTPAPYPQPNADDPICGDPVKWAREFGG